MNIQEDSRRVGVAVQAAPVAGAGQVLVALDAGYAPVEEHIPCMAARNQRMAEEEEEEEEKEGSGMVRNLACSRNIADNAGARLVDEQEREQEQGRVPWP